MVSPVELEQLERRRRSLEDATRAEGVARAKLEAAMVDAARAGATQREIATAASVSQPYVQRVLASRQGRFMPRSRLGFALDAQRRDVVELLRRRGFEDVRVFGSVARGEDGAGSDIDLAARLPAGMGLLGLAEVELELEEMLGARVDLVPVDSLKSAVRESAAGDMVPL